MVINPIVRILDVLYVEDDPQIAKLIVRELAYAVRTHVVGTLAAAFESLSIHLYDAVLLDLSLPDSKGFDSIKRLRSRYPTIPIIVFTGSGDSYDEQAQEAIDAGASWWIEKGTSATEMVRAIRLQMVKATLHKLKNKNMGTGE